MSLSNFFKINLPYGIQRNSNDEWMAFNREYVPLGWNANLEYSSNNFADYPIYTKYKGLTDLKLSEIAGSLDMIHKDSDGKIIKIYFYDDKTNPSSSPKHWDLYLKKIKAISSFERK